MFPETKSNRPKVLAGSTVREERLRRRQSSSHSTSSWGYKQAGSNHQAPGHEVERPTDAAKNVRSRLPDLVQQGNADSVGICFKFRNNRRMQIEKTESACKRQIMSTCLHSGERDTDCGIPGRIFDISN
ncbi:hypothetical protein SprV_0702308500 [Sparganum proliferum]